MLLIIQVVVNSWTCQSIQTISRLLFPSTAGFFCSGGGTLLANWFAGLSTCWHGSFSASRHGSFSTSRLRCFFSWAKHSVRFATCSGTPGSTWSSTLFCPPSLLFCPPSLLFWRAGWGGAWRWFRLWIPSRWRCQGSRSRFFLWTLIMKWLFSL